MNIFFIILLILGFIKLSEFVCECIISIILLIKYGIDFEHINRASALYFSKIIFVLPTIEVDYNKNSIEIAIKWLWFIYFNYYTINIVKNES